jgi:hypothetical protein
MTSGYDFLDLLRDDLEQLPSRAERRPARRLIPAATGIAIACAVGAAIVTHGGSSTVSTASAATFLNHAAKNALATAAPRLGPHQFYYEKYHGTDLGPRPGTTGTTERWMNRLGTGRERYNGSEIAGFSGSAASPATTPFGNESLTYAELQALPTDPEHLSEIIRHASTPAGPIGLAAAKYRTIGQLLADSPWPIPSRVRAAMLQVAATIPGLTIHQSARDCAGRPAIAVVNHEHGYVNNEPVQMRFALFFSPHTNLFLGERGTVVGHPHHPLRCVALLNAGVVNSQTATP